MSDVRIHMTAVEVELTRSAIKSLLATRIPENDRIILTNLEDYLLTATTEAGNR